MNIRTAIEEIIKGDNVDGGIVWLPDEVKEKQDQLLSLFKKYALEIVGEDENEIYVRSNEGVRNQLRQELRTKILEEGE